MRQTLILYARVESGHASRQKRGECVIFVYWLVQIQGARHRR